METALALEVIFQKPVSELLGGVYQKVGREVAGRAEVLAEIISKRNGTKANARKRTILANIANETLATI